MSSEQLDNLVRIGKLQEEPPGDDEIEGLERSGRQRLEDAAREDPSYSSRFDLAYNAAHSLALSALRRKGYRPDNRYIVFQTLPHTVGLKSWRVLAKAHDQRNRSEYEGYLDEDAQLLEEMIDITHELLALLNKSPTAESRLP